MHSYRIFEDGTLYVQSEGIILKHFNDEAVAIAFVNFLNGGNGDVAVAKRLLRQAEEK